MKLRQEAVVFLVDEVKPRSSGASNDGNTGRFFVFFLEFVAISKHYWVIGVLIHLLRSFCKPVLAIMQQM
jgi:hypothetical protein